MDIDSGRLVVLSFFTDENYLIHFIQHFILIKVKFHVIFRFRVAVVIYSSYAKTVFDLAPRSKEEIIHFLRNLPYLQQDTNTHSGLKKVRSQVCS